MDHVLVILLFIVVVALAVSRGVPPAAVAALVAAAVLVGRRRSGGNSADDLFSAARLAQAKIGGGLLADDPSGKDRMAGVRPGGGETGGRRIEQGGYMGAVDGPSLSDDCDKAPWSGVAPDDGDLQSDELIARQVRARDQYPARQVVGAHMRRQALVANAVSDELAEQEDLRWWGRGDA